MPPVRPLDGTAGSTFELDLLQIFPDPIDKYPSNSTSPRTLTQSQIKKQYNALTALLPAWERSPHGPAQAVQFVCDWGVNELFQPQRDGTPEWLEVQTKLVDLFRRRYGDLVASIKPSPSAWLASQLDSPDRPASLALQRIGPHMIEHLANTEASLEALKIWRLLQDRLSDGQRLSRVVELQTLTCLVRGLTHAKYEQDAQSVAGKLQSVMDSTSELLGDAPNAQLEALAIDGHRALAKLAAARGQQGKLNRTLAELERMGWDAGTEGVARRIRAAALSLDLAEVDKQYEAALTAYPDATQKQRQQLGTALVHAHVRMDDIEGAVRALASLIRAGSTPRLPLVVTLLHGLARRHKVAECYALFDRLPEFGLKPTAAAYLPLASLHANLAEPEAVQRVMGDMLAVGVEPDVRIWTTLMAAYVNLGKWRPALQVYVFLEKNEDTKLRPDTATVNVLLRATVLSGVPATDALQLFRTALGNGIRPNAQTYTLVMQALCNSGLMDLAEDLFLLMDTPDGKADAASLPTAMTAVRPDVFIFSTMIKGYLERGDAVKAQACLQEMRARGIDPSSVTYGIIVGSLVKDHSKQGMLQARDLAHRFLSADADTALLRRHTRPTTFDRAYAAGLEAINVVGPLLNAFAKRADADAALTVFRHVLTDQMRPSVPLYTSLMDAYRRAHSPENVRLVFDRLHASYLDFYPGPLPSHDVSDQTRRIAPERASDLCYAVSIYLDAHLGSSTVAETKAFWRRLASQGFVFDAGNWNALALSLAYRGEVSYAFAVVEQVLCRAPDEPLDSRVLRLRFGVPHHEEARLFTSSRLFLLRKAELDAHRKQPVSIQDLLRPELPLPELPLRERDASLSDLGGSAIDDASATRLRSFWFPHGTVLAACEQALKLLREEEARGAPPGYRQWLERTNPRVMNAIRQRRASGRRLSGEMATSRLVRGKEE